MSDDNDADDILEAGKRRYKAAFESQQEQAKRERNALKFQDPKLQWDEDARRQRLGANAPGVPQPPRPCLSVDKVGQPIRQVTNQERNAHLGVQIHPISPDAVDDTAEVIQDLYRSIEQQSQANLARSWAFDRAVKAGRGWYRVNTCYDHDAPEEGPEAFDQVITIERILQQDLVVMDPSATKSDFSDAEFAFVGAWVPLERFKSLYPDAKVPTEEEFTEDPQEIPKWITYGDDKAQPRAVLVVEYWFKEHEDSEVTYKQGKETLRRRRDKVTVKVCKMTGIEIVEEPAIWNGRHIPLVPVLGRELQPFDDERRWYGVIEPNMDAQRMYNYAASQLIELVALEPKAPFIGAADQFADNVQEWQAANVSNFSYLSYKPVVAGGSLLPPPARVQIDASRLGPSMMLLQQSDQFLQAGTETFDPSLGRGSSREKSGKAIVALQQQGDLATSDFLANLADVSLQYEARVILDLIPSIYDRPGRIARVLDEEQTSRAVMLNQPYRQGPNGMQPVDVPAGQPMPEDVKHYDLAKGRYAVTVSVGRSRASKLESGAEEMGQILSSDPQLLPIIGPHYFRYRDFPGARQIADDLQSLRDQQFPFLRKTDPKNPGPSPEQTAAEAQTLKAQVQGLQQQLQAAVQQIQTDQAKQAALLQKAQMDNQTRVEIAAMQTQEKASTADLGAKVDMLIAMMKERGETKRAHLDAAHDVAVEAASVGHDIHREAGKIAAASMAPVEIAPIDFNAKADSIGRPLAADTGEV